MMAKTGCKAGEQCYERERDRSHKASYFVVTPLSDEGIATIVRALEQLQADPRLADGTVDLNAYGGVINRVAADANAFVHRNALASVQYTAEYAERDPSDVVDANAAWLRDFYAAMRPYVSGFAYQNSIDPELADWKHAYYGDNYLRLVRVKAAYDPDNVFRFAQSISTS
ncbi:MAG: BBE domain-containing protein [Egibacteraceae bacterium]